jgi:PAS domain S-box-containing protein
MEDEKKTKKQLIEELNCLRLEQIEQAKVNSEKFTKAFLQNSIPTIITAIKDGRAVEVSDAFLRLAGLKRHEVIGRTAVEGGFFTEEQRAVFFNELNKNGRVENLEMGINTGDGSLRYGLFNSVMMSIGNEKFLLTAIHDITERKQAEEEKAIIEVQNRQLQKSESLGRMAGAIAHHFNNKLGAVIGNLELALTELPKGGNPQARIIAAMKASGKAAEMSSMMLTYVGQSFEQRELLDLSDACVRGLPMIQAVMPANVVLKKDLPVRGPIVSTNADYIQQALTNLLTNAWEAIGTESGTVSLCVKTVSLAQISTAKRYPIDWQAQYTAYACLEVADTGCGIEDRDIEKIFDPFYSNKFTGRGMGLPVVLGILKTHNGVLTVESIPNQGSTFRIFFPLSEKALMRYQEAGSSYDYSISSFFPTKFIDGGAVLLAEDDEMMCNMAGTMLESFGFSVMKAKDGVEAMEIFGKHQSEIQFVLSDLTMPRMNGWETLTALRKLQPNIPVILASGYDKAHVMEGDHPELPQAFLAKPYNLNALRDAISQALGKID